MRRVVSASLVLTLVSCTSNDSLDDEAIADASESGEASDGSDSSESGVECTYPDGAVEPMTVGEVLTAYSWPTAIHADGTTTSLDLEQAHCATDEVIDWSIHELLVFIAIPAW